MPPFAAIAGNALRASKATVARKYFMQANYPSGKRPKRRSADLTA